MRPNLTRFSPNIGVQPLDLSHSERNTYFAVPPRQRKIGSRLSRWGTKKTGYRPQRSTHESGAVIRGNRTLRLAGDFKA